jgi:hypothetical protein
MPRPQYKSDALYDEPLPGLAPLELPALPELAPLELPPLPVLPPLPELAEPAPLEPATLMVTMC